MATDITALIHPKEMKIETRYWKSTSNSLIRKKDCIYKSLFTYHNSCMISFDIYDEFNKNNWASVNSGVFMHEHFPGIFLFNFDSYNFEEVFPFKTLIEFQRERSVM